MSIVVFKKLSNVSRAGIKEKLNEILSELDLHENKVGESCLLKINAMSDEMLPGRNTSPWFLESVIELLKDRYPGTKFTIGDTDVAGKAQMEAACRTWGYNDIAKKHNVNIVNLAKQPIVSIKTEHPVCENMELPEIVVKSDSIINLPVLKTHVVGGITCALKNHWGLLPRFRYQLHPWVSEVIAEINFQVKHTVCTLVDGTVCMEGSGPKVGIPRIANVLFGGFDRVAVDSAVLEFMKMDHNLAPHVKKSEERGVGSMQFEISGDEFVPEQFELPEKGKDVVAKVESILRKIPLIGKVLYWPPIANVLGYIGTQYNRKVWMNIVGKKYIKILKKHPDYGAEFGPLD